ncbi:MAG: hypothetical protein ACYCOX_06415, partial [Acidobacteriaceae bacterium]
YINKGGPVQRISARTTQTHANPQRENKTAKKKFNASFSAACLGAEVSIPRSEVDPVRIQVDPGRIQVDPGL